MNKEILNTITQELGSALNRYQIAKNKAYDQYMSELEKIFMEHCFIDDGPMSEEQIQSVDDALAYVVELQRNGLMPSVISTEIDRKRRILLERIMGNKKQINEEVKLQ